MEIIGSIGLCELLIIAFVCVLQPLETLIDIQLPIAQRLQLRLLVFLFSILTVYVQTGVHLTRTVNQKICQAKQLAQLL